MSALGAFSPLPFRLGGTAEEGWSAAQHARACSDIAAVVSTSPFAYVTYSFEGDPAQAVVHAYNSMPGNGIAFAPTITRLGDGIARVSWGISWSDAYLRPEPLAIRHAHATPQTGATAVMAMAVVQGDLASVIVYTADAATGSPVDCPATLEIT